MANVESAELPKPCVGPFDDPSAFVAPEFAPVLVSPQLAVLAIWNDEVNASLFQPFAQRIGVVGAVGDHPLRFGSRPTFGARDFDFGERGFRKRNFSRRGTFQPNSQRKTATVDQYYPLRALSAVGFTGRRARLFRWSEAAVQGHLLPPLRAFAVQRSHQRSLCVERYILSSHCFTLRQQVAGEGYLSGKTSTPHRCATPKACRPGSPVRTPTDGHAFTCDASVQAAVDQ